MASNEFILVGAAGYIAPRHGSEFSLQEVSLFMHAILQIV